MEEAVGIMAKLAAVAESERDGVIDRVTVSAPLAKIILVLLGRLSGPRQEELTSMNMPALLEELRTVLPGKAFDV